MDTTQGFVVPNPQSHEPDSPQQSTPEVKPRNHTSSWIPLVVLLIIVIALSAGVSMFLLSYQGSRAKVSTQPVTVENTESENPFAANSQANPFTTSDTEAVNPFDESTSTTNPFEVFSEESQPSDNSGEYQNPF